jgi:hypothetical protein
MSRRFQFSLRALLGFAVLACLVLAGRYLLGTYGTRLDVEIPRVGDPIRVKATYFRLFGPRECRLFVEYRIADGSLLSSGAIGASQGDIIKRSWLCLYTIETELEPIDRPCSLIVRLYRFDKFVLQSGGKFWPLKEKMVEVK